MRGMLCTYCLSFGFSWYRQLALKGRRLCHVCRVGLSAKIVRILRTHHDGSLELRGSGLGEAFCSGLTRNSVLRNPLRLTKIVAPVDSGQLTHLG
jgi:hypothetical protein